MSLFAWLMVVGCSAPPDRQVVRHDAQDTAWAVADADTGAQTEDVELCGGGMHAPLSDVGLRHAAALADRSAVSSAEDVRDRLVALSELFAACDDDRGFFTAVYVPITARAVERLRAGAYADEAWAEALIVDFAGRYFDALAAELAGRHPGAGWDRYYALADDPGASRVRVAGTGVAVHLILDLPRALVAVGTADAHEADFLLFGSDLVAVSDEVVENLRAMHAVDADALFSGFFLGEWLDGAFGEAFTTTYAFTALRGKAWNNRWLIQNGWEWAAEAEMAASFGTVDLLFASLDAQGAL